MDFFQHLKVSVYFKNNRSPHELLDYMILKCSTNFPKVKDDFEIFQINKQCFSF